MSADSQGVYLQMLQGPTPGRVFSLPPGSSLTIGRLPDCDITDPDGLTLSRLHAVVEYHTGDCWLVNRSSNGTFVNDESIERIRLLEGDVVRCAQLLLKYVGAQAPEKATTQFWESATRYEAQPPQSYRFAETVLPVGWSWLSPQPEATPREVPFHRFVEMSFTPYLIIDWRRLSLEIPADSAPSEPLFHWLPPESAKLASPVVMPGTDVEWSRQLLEQGAGKDAILVVFSGQPYEDVVTSLRQATGYGESTGLVGYCWPSVFAQLVKHQSGEMIQRVLTAGSAWFFDQADGWSLVVNPDVRQRLADIGWKLDRDRNTSEGP